MTEAISWQDRVRRRFRLEYKNEWKKSIRLLGMKFIAGVFWRQNGLAQKKINRRYIKRAYKLIGFQEYVIYQLTHQMVFIHSRAGHIFDIKKLEWSE